MYFEAILDEPTPCHVFRLKWNSGGGLVGRRDTGSSEFSMSAGDLGHEVNEFFLVAKPASLRARAPRSWTDQQTGQSCGYGFVRFSDEQDQQRALVEMQGVPISGFDSIPR
ncbi:RNA-binding post-transcriptional regulator csx1 [Apiospora phragmitis]|uniref:RNA-binding post-transcriptional regulator csx1 n=1 Tax=Apiospora phragmitis TaxID=2905665 RepID=A0ABR1VSJ5_9PEZI